MDAFLTLLTERRRLLFDEAGTRLGLAPASVEKDFWVCWTLRHLFALPATGPHLTFKGGTSLSKCWDLIRRFSEDIDIVIDRDFLGFGGEDSPEAASSQKQRGKRLDELKAACQEHIQAVLLPDFTAALNAALQDVDRWTIDMDADDPDQQTIVFQYPTVTESNDYIRPSVRVELGSRSDIDPAAQVLVAPYIAEVFPEEVPDAAFEVRAVAPERTFLEKLCLIHEENHRKEGLPAARLARHFSDLARLIDAGVAARALDDEPLFERVVAHRKVFFRRSGEAQATMQRGSLRLVPPDDRRTAWAQDYAAMRPMFPEEPPAFDDILAVVGDFERRFNGGGA